MRLLSGELEEHVLNLADLTDRYGARIDAARDLEILHEPGGVASFRIVATLVEASTAPPSTIEFRERWLRGSDDRYERAAYAYELLDRGRRTRRAFHLHDPDWFQRRYLVVSHEHCEYPLGHASCEHVFGPPVRDAFRGLDLLFDAWTGGVNCSDLPCLE